ncbi:hypothetical protein [Oceanobacillus aidingensis]|uniref:Uncharacterized protein n=1 Tax=Oceanobacillus aidingensis TaxID=645964 RepID=A0ABV9JVI8_9BACI
MNAIGLRVESKKINYCIIMPGKKMIIENLLIPQALNGDVPRQLSFIRTMLNSIICEYDINLAGLRTPEGVAQQKNVFRSNLEGVIQELFSGSTIERYFAGTKTSIASRLKKDTTEITEAIDGNKNIFDVENWDSLDSIKKECVLSALAILSEKGESI